MNANLQTLRQKIEEALVLADKLGENIGAIHLSTALDALEKEIKNHPSGRILPTR